MQKRTSHITAGLAALVVGSGALLGLSACGNKVTQPWNDSPRTSVVNNTPADVIAMPDGFNNLATKCDHGNRIYVSFHSDSAYAAVAVVQGDPTCK